MKLAASGERVFKGNVRSTLAAGSTGIRMLLLAALLCAPVLASAQYAECVCSGDVCTCKIPHVGPIDNICHKQQNGDTCFKVSPGSSSQDIKVRNQGCTCEGTQCTCAFGRVLEGDQICSKSFKDTSCTAARVLDELRIASTVDCVCSGGVCTCNIPRFRRIDNICHARQQGNTCFKVPDPSDYIGVKDYEEGCSCGSTHCTCKFGTVLGGDQICSKSAEDTTCYTVSVSEEANTRNKYGCTCSGGICSCPVLQRPRSIKRICLVPRLEPCLPVRELDKLGILRLPGDRECICSPGQCVCHFRNDVKDGKMCFETSDGVECVPIIRSSKETSDMERGLFEESEPPAILPVHEKKCTEIEGKPVTSGGFRYVVALVMIEKDTQKFVCSGSLVASQKIITAAHCVRQSHGKYWAIAGSKDLSVHEASEQRRRVVEQIPHRNYFVRRNVPHNDVAVFIVYSPFIMNTFIQPANMEITPTDSLFVFVTGWGNVQDHPPAKDELHFTTSMVMPRSRCLKYIPHLDDHSMCVTPGEENERGCLGDHGSGAMIGDSILGIVSWLHLTDQTGLLVMMNVTRYKDFFSTYIM